MPNPLYTLFNGHINTVSVPSLDAEEAQKRLRHNLRLLSRTLNKKQSKLLLDVIDDKDLLCCITGQYNFYDGLKWGVRFTSAAFHKDMDL